MVIYITSFSCAVSGHSWFALFSMSLLFAGEKCSGLFLLFLFIYEKHMGRWQQVMCALSEVGSRQKRRRIAEAVHSELASCFESGDDCRSDDHSVNVSAEQGGKVPLSDPTTRLSQSHSAFNLSCSLVTGEGDVCGLSSLSTESGTSILPNAEHVLSSSSGGDGTSQQSHCFCICYLENVAACQKTQQWVVMVMTDGNKRPKFNLLCKIH